MFGRGIFTMNGQEENNFLFTTKRSISLSKPEQLSEGTLPADVQRNQQREPKVSRKHGRQKFWSIEVF